MECKKTKEINLLQMLMFWVLQVLINKLGKMPKYALNFKLMAITPSELLFWSIYSLNFTHPIHYICQFAVKILAEYAPETHVMLKYQNQQSKPQWKKRERHVFSGRERYIKNQRTIPLRCRKIFSCLPWSYHAFQQHIWITV